MSNTWTLLAELSAMKDFKMWRETKIFIQEKPYECRTETKLFIEAEGICFNASYIQVEEAIFHAYFHINSRLEARKLIKQNAKIVLE